MANRTTLGVGGPADFYVEVSNISELCALLRYVKSADIDWTLIGDGSNILVSERGVRGVVIRLIGDFMRIDVDGLEMRVGCAAKMTKVADIAAECGLTGLEGVGTVPGTVGGIY